MFQPYSKPKTNRIAPDYIVGWSLKQKKTNQMIIPLPGRATHHFSFISEDEEKSYGACIYIPLVWWLSRCTMHQILHDLYAGPFSLYF